MGLKTYRPTSSGQRARVSLDYSEITKAVPEKSLIKRFQKKSGRGFRGWISARHRGGGSKKIYRMIDFKRDKDGIPSKVYSIEYDPNRNCFIALLIYQDGEKRYILAPEGLKVGQSVISGPEAELSVGNSKKLKDIPIGTFIHNVELTAGRGGQLARAAASFVQITAKEGEYAVIKLPSGEVRMLHVECRASIGQVGNLDAINIKIGKAGRNRHRGWRPYVRGLSMNPCDHPHGGGEGGAPIGHPGPLSPQGRPTLGKKTRKPRKPSDRFIIARIN
jgi:large subunit ribosomal protein L2